jgi:anti-sigma B factor antagonist
MLESHDGPTRLSTACWLDATRGQDNLTLTLQGEFDLACKQRFQHELGQHMDNTVSRLVLDLRELTSMDSTGLGMLVALDAIARSDDFEFAVLCNGDGPVRMVLRETGLDGILPVVDGFGAVPATDSPV